MDYPEIERQTWLFEEFRKLGDSANFIAAYDRLADHHYNETVASNPAFRPDLPAIVSSFQPKSGGTFLHNRMKEIGYLEYWWGIQHTKDYATVYAAPKALDLYLRGGCTAHTHAVPHPNIVTAFEQANIKKVWVHIRHPAECAVSAYYHYEGIGHGTGEFGATWSKSAIEQRSEIGLPAHYQDFFEQSLLFSVDWIDGWGDFAIRNPGMVHFTSHRDLSDLAKLLASVFAAHDVDTPETGHLSSSRQDDRRRTQGIRDWRSGLSQQVVRSSEELVVSRLGKFPLYDLL